MYIQIYIEEPWLTSDSLTSDRLRSESRFNSPPNDLFMTTRYTQDSPLWANSYYVFFSVVILNILHQQYAKTSKHIMAPSLDILEIMFCVEQLYTLCRAFDIATL